MKKAINVEEYISGFPGDIQKYLSEMRSVIKETVPEAEETISYSMPAYKLNGVLVYFAAFKNHIGFYPTSSAIKEFKNELTAYKSARGSIQFPLGNPLPLDLVAKIVRFRKEENMIRKNAAR
jgi:uncharacterized protein YdhG (YjbR/CyaY superfamily)